MVAYHGITNHYTVICDKCGNTRYCLYNEKAKSLHEAVNYVGMHHNNKGRVFCEKCIADGALLEENTIK